MIRGGIFASSAAAIALVLAGTLVVASYSDASAQAKKKDAPLDTKGDASARPWKRYNGWPARDESKWNTLAHMASPAAPKEPRKLTGPIAGDAANGEKLVADRNRGGSCLACHVMGKAGGANLKHFTPGNHGWPCLMKIKTVARALHLAHTRKVGPRRRSG
jgi:sulfur-oxidizing protein SoxA